MKVNSKHSNEPLSVMKGWSGKCLLVVMCVFGLVKQAQACEATIANVTAPVNINVDPTLPTGSTVGSLTVSFPKIMSTPGSCADSIPWGNNTVLWAFNGEGTPDGNLYPTTIPGLAYRGSYSYMSAVGMGGYWPQSNYWITGGSNGVGASSLTLEFVKTGSLEAGGTFGPQVVMTWMMGPYPYIKFNLASPVVIKPTVVACTVLNSTIPVKLEDAATSQLKNATSTAMPKSFTIPLQCNGTANISLSFSGTMADSANGVFKSSDSDTADSVGIQLLDQFGGAVNTTFGSHVTIGSVTGSLNYPMTARYYALKPGGATGNVSAVAYATITYN